jgi:predicted nucleic acid-binding protein
VALGLGLPVTGKLGVLILAKRAGIVDAIRPLLDALTAAEFRLDTRLRAWVLTTAGEDE